MIKAWHADISQVTDMDNFKYEVRHFLNKAFDRELNVIHQVQFIDGLIDDLKDSINE